MSKRHAIPGFENPDLEATLLPGAKAAKRLGRDRGRRHDAVESRQVAAAHGLGGSVGDDELYGGVGDDLTWSGRGDDLTWGGRGDDVLVGGDADDTLIGDRAPTPQLASAASTRWTTAARTAAT